MPHKKKTRSRLGKMPPPLFADYSHKELYQLFRAEIIELLNTFDDVEDNIDKALREFISMNLVDEKLVEKSRDALFEGWTPWANLRKGLKNAKEVFLKGFYKRVICELCGNQFETRK